MSNFANLKAAINAVIKANGQREITGEVMNQVLTAMVNSLGSNYQFAGVATPSTNPGTPDQNVFYMATQAGTYTNFSAIVLQAGISILLWNGSWTSETFFTVDAVPTSGSNNFITSGAVFDKMKLDGGAYDVTAHNDNATFADLSALLNSENLNTLIPVAVRHGGMSIKFVQTSDNKYVQYRLMSDTFNTTPANWQICKLSNAIPWATLINAGEREDRCIQFFINKKQAAIRATVRISSNVLRLVYSINGKPNTYRLSLSEEFTGTVTSSYAAWLYFNINTKQFYFDSNYSSWNEDCVMIAYLQFEQFTADFDYGQNVICPSMYSVNGQYYHTHFSKITLDNINSVLGNLTKINPNETNINGYVNTDGSINTNFSGYRHDKYVISDEQKLYKTYLPHINISSHLPFIACYDSNDVYLGSALTFAEIGAESSTPSDELYGFFRVLPNTSYVFLSYYKSYVGTISEVVNVNIKLNLPIINDKIETIENKVETIESNLFEAVENKELLLYKSKVDGFYNQSGQLVTQLPDWKHDIFDISSFVNITSLKGSTSFKSGSSIPVFVFLDSSENFIGYYKLSASASSENPDVYTDEELVGHIPQGTKYVVIQKYPVSYTPTLVISGTAALVNKDDFSDLENKVETIENNLFETVQNKELPLYKSKVDGFYNTSGQINTQLSDWKHDIFDISSFVNITSLKGSTSFNAGGGIPVFVFLDSSENFISYYKLSASASSENPDVYTDEELVGHIPQGTKYVVIQKHPVNYTPTLVISGSAFVVVNKDDFSDLENKVETIENKVETLENALIPIGDTRPKITFKINASSFFVRSSLDETRDVVIRYDMDLNGYYRPQCAYIGLNTISSINGFTSSFHNTSDSIAPVETQYWFIGGQHGYLIPTVTMVNHGKDNDDIGSWWKDIHDNKFQLIKIAGDVLTFAPEITVDGQGVGHRGYNFGYTMTTLTHVSGASHTSQITIDSQSSVQLVPCTTDVSNKVYCNGVEITSELYNKEIVCTEVKYMVSGDVFNPATLTKVLPPMEGEKWFNITQTYTFIGLTCSVKQSWKLFAPLVLSAYYGATQPLGFTSFGDYHSYMFNPKVKSVTANGKTTDWKYPQDTTQRGQTWAITHFHINVDEIEDVNNLPDRTIQYYQNPNTQEMLVGFASGLSMISSATQNEKRKVNIGNNGIVFHIANDGRNKLYFRVITSSRAAGNVLPANTTLNFNYYQCYYDPNSGDSLTYWYKDGSNYVIYIHSFALNNSAEIIVPEFMEGLNLEVVEKSSNADLLTDSIVNNKLYVGFSSADAGYIVLKTI